MTSYDWLIALGIMFGFALAISLLADFTIEKFFGYFTFLNCFMIWIDFLPLWTLVLNVLVLVFIIITKSKNKVI